ncbi:MAG: flippase [Colwellia sp.]|nr:flippase [Colwellia sp.]
MSLFSQVKKNKTSFAAIKNTGWLVGEKVLSMLLVLLVNIFVARHLGPESFGLLNYLLAVIALLIPLSSLGLNAIVTRELVVLKHTSLSIMTTVTAIRFLGGLLASIILITCLYFGVFSRLQGKYWAIILLSLANVLVAFHVIDFWFQAKVQSKYIVKVRFISVVLISSVKLILVYFKAPLTAFIWASAVESVLLSIGFIAIYKIKKGDFELLSFDFSYGMSLLKQSKWLVLSGVASIIYLKIDQVMLSEMVSTTETGIYSVASRMSEVWYFFPTALVASFFPALIKLKEESTIKYQQNLQRLCDVLFFGALIIAILITLIADKLIIVLYGEQYTQAGTILALHVWAGVFVFMRALLSKWLLAEHLLIFSFVTHGVGAIINVGLNLWLIPLYQGKGAAIATVISYAFASYFVLFFHRSTWPMAKIMTKSLFFPSRFLLDKVKLNN